MLAGNGPGASRSQLTDKKLCSWLNRRRLRAVAHGNDEREGLWSEYLLVFRDFDDLSLARWMAQTLSQLEGRVLRISHPLVGAYRLAAEIANERQVWLKRLVTVPPAFPEASCCRAPLVPLLTRDVMDTGLLCQHCTATVVTAEDLPAEISNLLEAWSEEYKPIHAVAHWEDKQRSSAIDYQQEFEHAAQEAERLLAQVATQIAPKMLDYYPVVLWEDQDECLEVGPDDVELA